MAKLIINFTPAQGQEEAMTRYRQAAGPLFAAIGGKPTEPVRIVEEIAGGQGMAMSLVMDFESAEVLSALFASDAYAAVIPLRDAAFADIQILITEDAK